MKHDTFDCIICKTNFHRRKKGMKDRSYKDSLRPYRSITCSRKCAIVYNRMPLNKRNLLKVQGGIINMNEYIPEIYLAEDIELCMFDDGKEEFGFLLRSGEKCNESLPDEHEAKYYHDTLNHHCFKKRENLEMFKKGLKLIDDALTNEDFYS